jgi:hypothetical protein
MGIDTGLIQSQGVRMAEAGQGLYFCVEHLAELGMGGNVGMDFFDDDRGAALHRFSQKDLRITPLTEGAVQAVLPQCDNWVCHSRPSLPLQLQDRLLNHTLQDLRRQMIPRSFFTRTTKETAIFTCPGNAFVGAKGAIQTAEGDQ